VNFTDLGRYKVAFVDPGSADNPDAGLATSEPADLYADPE